MKKIKNYIILAIIFITTISGTFYVRSWYNTTKEYYSQNSIMPKVINEIKSEELSNYILENQNFILYVSSAHNIELKPFENELKKVIEKLDARENILYLNIDETDSSSLNILLKSFTANEKIKDQIPDDITSNIYVFKNGKITTVLNKVNNYSSKRIETLLKKWGVNNA